MLALLWGGCLVAGITGVGACSTSSTPPPPPPPTEPPPPPPPPPADVLAVSAIRGVQTEIVPQALLDSLTERLRAEVGPAGQPLDLASTADPTKCVSETCRLEAAKAQAAKRLLHTRLIQYDAYCVLLSVLYDVESKQSEWGYASALPCQQEGLTARVSALAAAFANRPPGASKAPYAVIPVQHKLEDLVWASESFAEYITALLAQSGLTVLPSAFVLEGLGARKETPHRACGGKSCPAELAMAANASQSVTTQIKKRGRKCSVGLAIYSVQTKTSTRSEQVQGGCEAKQIAESIEQAATALLAPEG